MLAWIAARELVPRARAEWMSRHAFAACASLGLLAAALTAARNIRVFDVKPLHVSVTTAAIGIVAGAALVQSCRKRNDARRWALGIGSILALVLGALLQIGDRPGNFLCHPGGLFQAHAWWHVFGAASVALGLECLAEADDVAA